MLHPFALLICACVLCMVSAQDVCDGCICDHVPGIDTNTIETHFIVRNIPGSSLTPWVLDMNITWTAPLETSHDYAVRLTRRDDIPLRCSGAISNVRIVPPSVLTCPIQFSHQKIVSQELYTKKNIAFGYRFLFDISLYNISSDALARTSVCINDIYSPDCYEATKDEDFCSGQPTLISGKPVNTSLLSFESYETEGNLLLSARVTWSDPIQVNGDINRYTVETYDVTNGTERIRVNVQSIILSQGNVNASTVHEISVPGLAFATPYQVRITPYVNVPSDLSNEVQIGLRDELLITTPPLSAFEMSTDATTVTNSKTGRTPDDQMPVTTGMMSTVGQGPPAQGADLLITIVTSVAVALLVILFLLAIYFLRRRRERRRTPYKPGSLDLKPQPHYRPKSTDKSSPQDVVEPIFRAKEVRHDQVEIIDPRKPLGSGQFGVVHRGRLVGCTKMLEHGMVAVKTVKDDVTENMKNDFLNEIRLMIEMGANRNVMEVIACCTVKLPYYMITELMKYGDLLHFLRKCNKSENIENDSIYDASDLHRYQIARQIANGMVFISSKRFYHGDLAARNILVGSGLTVKISDFGLSNDIYQKGYQRLSAERKRPIKWASIETNLEGKCTIQSDVWSYGVVLYEIFTNGEMPYKDMDVRELIHRVKEGYRMGKPDKCPDDVYSTMLQCWHQKPGNRPSFKNLFTFFDKKIAATSSSEYLDMENDVPLSSRNQMEDNVNSEGASTALSGESVRIQDWTFHRDPSTRRSSVSNDEMLTDSIPFNSERIIYERYKDADIT